MCCATVTRRALPPSANFGGASFRLVFLILPTDEVLISEPFEVYTKQMSSRAPRRKPNLFERYRHGPADTFETAVNVRLRLALGKTECDEFGDIDVLDDFLDMTPPHKRVCL